jgi:hypothetical protein
MRKFIFNDSEFLPKDLLGLEFPEDYIIPIQIKKYRKLGAVKVEGGFVTDYRKCVDTDKPRVYTVDFVSELTFRLFQVGKYEDPVIFRLNGHASTPYRSKNYMNWDKYRLVPLTEDN